MSEKNRIARQMETRFSFWAEREKASATSMPEFDHIVFFETSDPQVGPIRYSITSTINVICPRCGNPDCEEMEALKERLAALLWPPETTE